MRPPTFPSSCSTATTSRGPRYTSYPDGARLEGGLRRRATTSGAPRASAREADAPAPLSLYLHLPFCEKLCYFCGCTVVITGQRARAWRTPYLALARERDRLGGATRGRARTVRSSSSISGGGTPTYFAPDRLRAPRSAVLRERFRFAAGRRDRRRGRSARHDAGAPRSRSLRLGFNRLSMGVQDFDPARPGRHQPHPAVRGHTARSSSEARALGFPSVNMDLIYGLPHQTADDVRATIDRVLAIGSGSARRLLLRERPVDEEAPGGARAAPARRADEVRDLPHRARAVHGRRLRVHRHGPLRAARRRAGAGPRASGRCTATSRATRPRRGPTFSASA